MIGIQSRQISDHVWQIGTFEFPQYLVGEDPFLVMEGGVSPQSRVVLTQIQEMGRFLGTLQFFCILHGHFDHLGTFPYLREKVPDARVVSGEMNQRILSNPRILKRMLASSQAVTAYAREINFLPDLYELTSLDPIPVDVPMTDGASLSCGDLFLEFISLPGHSPDAMGAYLSKDGVFFCSDMAGLYFPDGTIRPNYYYSLEAYEASLERIHSYEIETLCFGHNGTLAGYREVRAFLEQSVDFTGKLKRQIKDWFQSGRDLEKLAQQFAHGARKGFLAFFPFEHNLMLSRLIIRRTLEYYGLDR